LGLDVPLKRGAANTPHPGLGLGLYIVREIAKGHGGTAEARSDATRTVLPRCSTRAKSSTSLRFGGVFLLPTE
jgi:signal transduction histidine kinase